MSIERNLAKLTAKQNRDGDRVAQSGGSVPVIASATSQTDGQPDVSLKNDAYLKRSGAASLDTGNAFHGLPQVGMEIRSAAETVIDLGNRSGAIIINVARANVFKINLTGAATFTFTADDWPYRAFERSAASGLDYGISLLISKGATTLGMTVDHWAPKSAAPDLSKAGFYEIGIAICVVNGVSVVRGYPVIVPA